MSDETQKPAITPDLKIGDLLDAWPELEDLLIETIPAFSRLRNPVLRRTVARVTTIHQAARVGGVSLGDLITRLRRAVGQEEDPPPDAGEADGDRPAWLEGIRPKNVLDARAMIEEGGHPLGEVVAAVRELRPGEAYGLVTPFVPAPLIDRVRALGCDAWTERRGPDEYLTIFRKR